MENHYGELIYLLFGVGLFIYSMFRKKKPKAEENSEGVVTEQFIPKELKHLFMPQDIWAEEKQEKVRYSIDEVELDSVKNVNREYIDTIVPEADLKPLIVVKEKSNREKETEALAKSFQHTGEKSRLEEIMEDFDIERAIVYSEILKPKYI